MDGTALDSMGFATKNYIRYLKILDVELNDEEVKGLRNLGWGDVVHYINKIKNTNFTPKGFYDGLLETHYDLYKRSFKLMPGFLKFIDYLDEKGIKYAIAT